MVVAGANPVLTTWGIEKTAKALVSKLKVMSKEVEDNEFADVATVSAGNNYDSYWFRLLVMRKHDEVRAARVDIVGGVEFIKEIASTDKTDFDRCFLTHSFMKRLYKISKILNQHGLMPNPKQGTITKNVMKAIKKAK